MDYIEADFLRQHLNVTVDTTQQGISELKGIKIHEASVCHREALWSRRSKGRVCTNMGL